VGEAKPLEPFLAYAIPADVKARIDEKLQSAKTVEDVNWIFDCVLADDEAEDDRMRKAVEQLNALLNKYVPAEKVEA
jgi:hypothetical protein